MSALLRITDSSWTLRHVSKVPIPEVVNLPGIPHHALARVAASDVGEFTFEGGCRRPAVQPFQFGGGRGQRRVSGLRGAVDDEGSARQRLERRGDGAVGIEIVRPGEAAAQRQYTVLHGKGFV